MVQRDNPWEPGTPCWADLMTTDPTAGQDFYRQLFGWQIEAGGPETGHYGMCLVNGRAVAGIGGMSGEEGHPPVWSTYLATADADATVAAAERLGATVVAPVMDVMEFGRMAFLQLPTGGVFGIWQAGTHHGFAVADESNSVGWNEFVTRDYAAATEFYAQLFGYHYTEMGDGTFHYATISLEPDGRPVGGIGDMPSEVPAQVPAHWRVYFNVDDADASAARVRELGGSVLLEPRDMPYGRWGDVADPQGAMFSIIRPADGQG